ncbi:hypothetical protein NHQ30_011406 [Ciborinia camelliae]|nr:hypothetical protein NHQ30_011406 [Ciborinia camelliae]
MIVRTRETSQDKLRTSTKAGIRQLTFARQELSLEKLQHFRICPTLDPTRDIRQIQTPCQVGCATNLLTRSSAHDPLTKMKSSSTFLTLTVSTREVMLLKQKVFQIPTLKVWRPNQLGLAEIFITMLAGSLVWDGGLNRIKAGAKELDQSLDPDIVPDKKNLREAKRQIFLEHNWAMENYRASNEALLGQSEILKTYQERDRIKEEINSDAEKLIEEIQDVSERVKNIRLSVQKRTEQIENKAIGLVSLQLELEADTLIFDSLPSNYKKFKNVLEKHNKNNVDPNEDEIGGLNIQTEVMEGENEDGEEID